MALFLQASEDRSSGFAQSCKGERSATYPWHQSVEQPRPRALPQRKRSGVDLRTTRPLGRLSRCNRRLKTVHVGWSPSRGLIRLQEAELLRKLYKQLLDAHAERAACEGRFRTQTMQLDAEIFSRRTWTRFRSHKQVAEKIFATRLRYLGYNAGYALLRLSRHHKRKP